ncbi:MAG: DUF1573 domain-containing protein [Chitinophagaceae bacterium]|nr:DUF1573 domain-containing protein [Chitinophagaceae bacterium]
MKTILLVAAAFIASIVVKAQNPDEVIKVSTDKYDFGKVKQGVPVTTYFEITNKTNKPIYLESVTASCGCTTPEWSKVPIPAGGTKKIKVGYNAAAMNHFEKDVFIKVSGVPQTKVVKITGDVMDATAYDAYMKDVKAQDDKKTTEVKAKTDNTKVKVATTNGKTKKAKVKTTKSK